MDLFLQTHSFSLHNSDTSSIRKNTENDEMIAWLIKSVSCYNRPPAFLSWQL